MRQTVRNEIFNLPRALRDTLEKGRRVYDAVIRRVPWGQTPVTFTGSAAMLPLAEFMAGAFESLLEWPCTVQPVSEAAEVAANCLPKSIWFLVSAGGDPSELLNLVQTARSRNAFVLALVGEKGEPLAQTVDGAFAVSQGEKLGNIGLPICAQAVAGYLALLTAHSLKKPLPQFETLEKEFAQLPGFIERAFSQHGEGIRSLAVELAHAQSPTIVAGGSYYCAAASSADLLSRVAGICARLVRVAEDPSAASNFLDRGSTALVLTGARGRMKKQTLAMVKAAKKSGVRLLTLTDGNDPEAARLSAMTLLLPPLDEISGSVMAHAVMACIVYEASRLSLATPRRAK